MLSLMNDDMVIIPLRVPREQRRSWRAEAGKRDQSVQAWLLEKICGKQCGALDRVATDEGGSTPPPTAKASPKPVPTPKKVVDHPKLDP